MRSSSQWIYLVYYINKGLSILPTETPDRLDFFAVCEDLCDQGDTIIWVEGTINQAFPRRDSPAHEKQVKGTSGQFQS